MAKQTRIPGTERTDHPEIEQVALDYCSTRDERSALSKKEHTKKVEMFALLRAHKLDSYKFWDPNAKKYRVARIKETDPTVEVVDTDEAIEEVGAGVATGEGETPAGMKGLIDMAKAANEANVEVTDEGDVSVPDTAAPKSKRSKKKPTDEASAS
jgi:hypothetical protein